MVVGPAGVACVRVLRVAQQAQCISPFACLVYFRLGLVRPTVPFPFIIPPLLFPPRYSWPRLAALFLALSVCRHFSIALGAFPAVAIRRGMSMSEV